MAAWAWTLGAVGMIAGVEMIVGLTRPGSDAPWVAPLRFFAAVLSLCPLMALLGAKRPQNGAWQFVVLSLWGVLALPAAEVFFLHRTAEFQVSGVRSWFLLALIVMGLMNHLPTRHTFAALLTCAAQWLLLASQLPGRPIAQGTFAALGGLALGTLAILMAARRKPDAAPSPLDRLWRDFRDDYGAFWALRLADRVNAAAQQFDWPVRLHWSGLVGVEPSSDGQLSPQVDKSLQFTLQSLLRRFVSDAWIAKRIDRSINLEEQGVEPPSLVTRKEHVE
jgi:hypothetical protein